MLISVHITQLFSKQICCISNILVEVEIKLQDLCTPGYVWNTAKFGVKHQSFNQFDHSNRTSAG